MKRNFWRNYDETIIAIKYMMELQEAGMYISAKAWKPFRDYLMSMDRFLNNKFEQGAYSDS